MASTTNLNIEKINPSDYVDPEVFNTVFDIIDKLGVDYVTEQGTSGDWWYRKWNSGILECGVYNKNFGTQKFGSSFTGTKWYITTNSLSFGSYPFAFTSRPYASVSYNQGTKGQSRQLVMQYPSSSLTVSPSFSLIGWQKEEVVHCGIYVRGLYQ